MDQMTYLYESLDRRYRPEDVADAISSLLGSSLSRKERSKLEKAARGSLRQRLFKFTSMMQDFARPVGLESQVSTARNLFELAQGVSDVNAQSPEEVLAFIQHISQEIHKTMGESDFLDDRLNREARKQIGMDISRRRYNKLFRHLVRMERKLDTYMRELEKYHLTKVAKSAFAYKITWEDFSADANTACLIAYLTARSNLRSEFTIYGQQRAYDDITDMLFKRCEDSQSTNWWAIAHVYPNEKVLVHLADEQKGHLLGQWFGTLQSLSKLLHEVWQASDINRESMVVRRGNDSSTWNSAAGAWNKARDHWIALTYALGLEQMLKTMCFGKVMRLMAADVAYWHQAAGKGLDKNTLVWRDLPLPWEVLAGEAECTLAMIEAVCQKHGVDAEKSGWIAPRKQTHIAIYRPTPELVHGVSVANPYLAKSLRAAGFFSGKKMCREPQAGDAILHGRVLHDHYARLRDTDKENT